MSTNLKLFIGYDPRQPVAYHVCAHSAISNLSVPAPLTRLQLDQLPMTRRGLTEFTYSRFLVPFLSDYDGYSVFLDADMLVRADLWLLLAEVNPSAAVSVVLHEQVYERPSLMVFNNKRCRLLTPEFVNGDAPLFDFAWATEGVGALPKAWNHTVGYDPPNPDAKVVHFTKGVPIWPETRACECADDWLQTLAAVNATVSHAELMGRSVHTIDKIPPSLSRLQTP